MKKLVAAAIACACGLLVYWSGAPALAAGLGGFQKSRPYTVGTFTDIAGHWGAGIIQNAYEYGIINGMGNNRFAPNGNLTGAEALTIGARIHAVYTYGTYAAIDRYRYDAPKNWYDSAVAYCKGEGLIGNDFDGLLNAYVTRSQMVHAWAKVLPESDLPAKNTVYALPDVTSRNAYYGEILNFYKTGVLRGVDAAGSFLPNSLITRAEATAIFLQLIEPNSRANGRVYGTAPITATPSPSPTTKPSPSPNPIPAVIDGEVSGGTEVRADVSLNPKNGDIAKGVTITIDVTKTQELVIAQLATAGVLLSERYAKTLDDRKNIAKVLATCYVYEKGKFKTIKVGLSTGLTVSAKETSAGIVITVE